MTPALCEWTDGAVRYELRPYVAGAMLTAMGPGIRIRTAGLPLDDPTVAAWLLLTDTQRTARAEQLLSRPA